MPSIDLTLEEAKAIKRAFDFCAACHHEIGTDAEARIDALIKCGQNPAVDFSSLTRF